MVEAVKAFLDFATGFPQMIFFVPAFIVGGGFILHGFFTVCLEICEYFNE